MKKNKFSVLGMLTMALTFNSVLSGCVTARVPIAEVPAAGASIAGTSWTAFYADEDEFDEMFVLVFGKNDVRVDEIEYEITDGPTFTLPYSSTYDVGTWSQTGKSVNVKFYETIWDENFNIIDEVFWEFKLKIIDERTMEGTILNNGELIGNAELYCQ